MKRILIALAFLLLSLPCHAAEPFNVAWMNAAIVGGGNSSCTSLCSYQSAYIYSQDTGSTTIAVGSIEAVSGETLVVVVGNSTSTKYVNAVGDTVNIYTEAGHYGSGTGGTVSIWYTTATTTATLTVTATFSASDTYRVISVLRLTGCNASPLLSIGTGAGTGTGVSTTASANSCGSSIIVAGYNMYSGRTFTAGSSPLTFTKRSNNTYFAVETATCGTGGVNCGSNGTLSTSDTWTGEHAIFK